MPPKTLPEIRKIASEIPIPTPAELYRNRVFPAGTIYFSLDMPHGTKISNKVLFTEFDALQKKTTQSLDSIKQALLHILDVTEEGAAKAPAAPTIDIEAFDKKVASLQGMLSENASQIQSLQSSVAESLAQSRAELVNKQQAAEEERKRQEAVQQMFSSMGGQHQKKKVVAKAPRQRTLRIDWSSKDKPKDRSREVGRIDATTWDGLEQTKAFIKARHLIDSLTQSVNNATTEFNKQIELESDEHGALTAYLNEVKGSIVAKQKRDITHEDVASASSAVTRIQTSHLWAEVLDKANSMKLLNAKYHAIKHMGATFSEEEDQLLDDTFKKESADLRRLVTLTDIPDHNALEMKERAIKAVASNQKVRRDLLDSKMTDDVFLANFSADYQPLQGLVHSPDDRVEDNTKLIDVFNAFQPYMTALKKKGLHDGFANRTFALRGEADKLYDETRKQFDSNKLASILTQGITGKQAYDLMDAKVRQLEKATKPAVNVFRKHVHPSTGLQERAEHDPTWGLLKRADSR